MTTRNSNVAMVTIVAMLILAALSGWGWHLQQRGRWLERKQDLQTQVDSTRVLLGRYTADSAGRQRSLDSLGRLTVRLSRDSTIWHQRWLQTLAAKTAVDSALTALRASVDEDSLPEAVKTLLAGERRALLTTGQSFEACQEGLRIAQEARSVCQTAQDTLQSEIVGLRGFQARLLAERDSALSLLKPPSLLSLTFELGVGPACLVGSVVRCGLGVQATVVRFRLPLVP